MSGRWFRFYSAAMRDPKVAKLSDKQFRLWVQLLAVASENDGIIPCLDDLKYLLNRRLDHLSTGVKELISMGLIDCLVGGYEPHNWSKFQYKSDTSKERVAKHRAKRNVTETAPDTETDTETDTEKKNIPASPESYEFLGRVIRLKSEDFKKWRRSYPDLDLTAALQSRDDWLKTEADEATRRKWFISTSNWLAAKQKEARNGKALVRPIA